jgi:hypothetical protein
MKEELIMDRKALSKRLEGLSSIFASETPIATDLKAMAYTLDKMSSEKFEEILSSEYISDGVVAADTPDEDKEVLETEVVEASKCEDDATEASDCDKGCECEKSASEEVGLYWNVEASDAILASLVKDVTGATLTKEQTPDGTKKAEKPATLKEDQTPSIKENLDSGIVKKSKGAVKKEAGSDKGPGVPDGTGPMKDTEECPKGDDKEAAQQDVVQAAKPEPGDIDENAAKPVNESGSLEDMAKNENKEAQVSEGVELNAPMMDVSLDTKEAEDLGRLFA